MDAGRAAHEPSWVRVEDNLDSTRELTSRVESESLIQFRVKNYDLESTREQLESKWVDSWLIM